MSTPTFPRPRHGRAADRATVASDTTTAPATRRRASLSRRSRVGVAGAVVVGGTALAFAVSALAAGSPLTAANDSFGRTLTSGWGTTTSGTPWTTWVAAPSTASVANNAGVMSLAPGASATAELRGVSLADSVTAASFSVDALPSSDKTVYVALQARSTGSSQYYARVRVTSTGAGDVSFLRQNSGVSAVTTVGTPVALQARIVAGRTFGLSFTVSGGTAVSLAATVTGDATTTATATDTSSSRLTAVGWPAVWAYVSKGTTAQSTAAVVRTRSYAVAAPTGNGSGGSTPAPTTPVPTTPTSPAPTATTPAPTPTTPAPTTSAPSTPVTTPPSTPAPTTPAPTPTTSSPSPTDSTPAPATSPTNVTGGLSVGVGAVPPPPVTNPPTPGNPPSTGTTGAGSAPLGSTNYPIPASALFVAPNGNDSAAGTIGAPLATVQNAINRAGVGQTIVLRGGTYHESVFVNDPKVITVQNYPGEVVWFDGAVPVTNWTPSGSTWVSTGWNSVFEHNASFSRYTNEAWFIDPNHPLAAYPDQMFIDGQQLAQVAAGTTPGAGQFAVDTTAHTLTIGSDPTGHDVRSSDLQKAWVIAGQVNLRGIGIRHYATSMWQMGAVYLGGKGTGSVLSNLVLDSNAMQALSISQPNTLADHLTVTNNGFSGIQGAYMDGSTVSNNLLYGNNLEGFNVWPASGDIKLGRSRNLTITGNDVSSSRVLGIWTDESVVGFTIANNYVHGPVEYGILAELSSSGTIVGNTVRNAKRGITTLNTEKTSITNNRLGDQSLWDVGVTQDARRQANPADPGHDPRQPIPDPTNTWVTNNILVANNVFADNTAGGPQTIQFYSADYSGQMSANQMSITVTGNVFSAAGSGRPQVLGWAGVNKAVNVYSDPNAFAAANGWGWTNTLVTGSTWAAAPAGVGVAWPVAGATAQWLGLPVGTRQVGPTLLPGSGS